MGTQVRQLNSVSRKLDRIAVTLLWVQKNGFSDNILARVFRDIDLFS